jgi:hypothetical protein
MSTPLPDKAWPETLAWAEEALQSATTIALSWSETQAHAALSITMALYCAIDMTCWLP